jgi:Cys-rich four helix bundle protein (predicted Tat secretion target)
MPGKPAAPGSVYRVCNVERVSTLAKGGWFEPYHSNPKRRKAMDRREFIAAAGTAAAVVSTSQAFAQMAAEESDMHPPKYKALEKATVECIATGNDCLRHCFGMYKMKDTSMADCADAAYQLVAGCGALASLAAVNSQHTGHLAKVVECSATTARKSAISSPRLPYARPAATRARPAPRNAVRPPSIRDRGEARHILAPRSCRGDGIFD